MSLIKLNNYLKNAKTLTMINGIGGNITIFTKVSKMGKTLCEIDISGRHNFSILLNKIEVEVLISELKDVKSKLTA